MGGRWNETLASINNYVKGLGSSAKLPVTLAAFASDGFSSFNVIRRSVLSESWIDLTSHHLSAGGGTPLYDAVDEIVRLSEIDNPSRAVIVIVTDGEENASTKVTRTGAMSALDRCRKRDWQVVHLGTDFANVEVQAASLGIARGQTISSWGTNGFANATMDTAAMSAGYFNTGAAMAYTESMRSRAAGKAANDNSPSLPKTVDSQGV